MCVQNKNILAKNFQVIIMANKTISFFLILILLLFSVWLFLPKNEEVLINDNQKMLLVKNGSGLG